MTVLVWIRLSCVDLRSRQKISQRILDRASVQLVVFFSNTWNQWSDLLHSPACPSPTISSWTSYTKKQRPTEVHRQSDFRMETHVLSLEDRSSINTSSRKSVEIIGRDSVVFDGNTYRRRLSDTRTPTESSIFAMFRIVRLTLQTRKLWWLIDWRMSRSTVTRVTFDLSKDKK